MSTLIKDSLNCSAKIKDGRTIQDSLTHLVTELGELAQEIQISEGKSYKKQGKDGVVGEAIDVIICAIDIIYLYENSITENDLQLIALEKLKKWKETVQ